MRVLKILAEIGIILLLFEVGLETDFDRLKDAGLKSFIVAILGVVLPFGVGLSCMLITLFNLVI